MNESAIPLLLQAATFAAEKHKKQLRKNAGGTPYINHPLAAADLLVSEGGVTDVVVLAAAILHDTIEDTQTSREEIEQRFGAEVASVVGRVVFDIRGNRYRLVVHCRYPYVFIRFVRTHAEYDASTLRASQSVRAFRSATTTILATALAEIGPLLRAKPGSVEEARLEVLSVLVRDYEAKHHSIPPPDPIEAIKFRLEQTGLPTKALEGVIGSRARVFEVLNGKRRLSLGMIRKLHDVFAIPLDSMLGTAGEGRTARRKVNK